MWNSEFDQTETEIYKKRIKILIYLIFIVFGLLFARLWFLQVVNGSKYRLKSENNRIDLRSISPFRGLVFDRNGELLVDNRPCFNLCVVPEDIRCVDCLVSNIGRLVEIDKSAVRNDIENARLKNPFDPVSVKKDISRDELARIETNMFNMPGVIIDVNPRRHYIYGPLAAHLIGYLGEINKRQLNEKKYKENRLGDFVGKYGIEKKWHRHLNGIRGGQQVEVDAFGRKLRMLSQKDAQPGENVYLTIDKDIQMAAERAFKGKAGAVVAMVPDTGEILAMVSSPAFDPNRFARGMDKKGWKEMLSNLRFPLQNRAVSGQYPPGSVFKIVVALAGLEEGFIDPDEEIFCKGSYNFKGREYRDWKKQGHGYVSLHKALVESCDVYFYKMGQRIGIDIISKYAKKVGFGSETGLGLGNEKPGLVPDRSWKLKKWHIPWQEGETLSVAIGQSFTLVTPIQMARFVSALFNGGTIYKPQVTKLVGNPGKGDIFELRPVQDDRWKLKEGHAKMLKNAMFGVVNEPYGTGGRARLEGIDVAGKTGTAQVISMPENTENGQEIELPYKFRDHAWFVAVAPVKDPEIALAVLVEHSGQGGLVAAPIAKKILETYFSRKKGD